jgi:hypothetical protein
LRDGDDGERDPRCDQPVFDRRGAALVQQKPDDSKHRYSPLRLRTGRRLCRRRLGRKSAGEIKGQGACRLMAVHGLGQNGVSASIEPAQIMEPA